MFLSFKLRDAEGEYLLAWLVSYAVKKLPKKRRDCKHPRKKKFLSVLQILTSENYIKVNGKKMVKLTEIK